MDASQQLILLILACTVGLFLWGRWRHDIVALAALLACVVDRKSTRLNSSHT